MERFIVWDLQKKKIKRKFQLVRPAPAEIEKVKVELEAAGTTEDTEDEKQSTVSAAIAEKLFPVSMPHYIIGRRKEKHNRFSFLLHFQNHLHGL